MGYLCNVIYRVLKKDELKRGDFNDIFANGIAGINPNDIENITILKVLLLPQSMVQELQVGLSLSQRSEVRLGKWL